jgi:hypothetical protein
MISGLELLHRPLGASILAVIVNAFPLVAAPHAEVVVALLPVAAAVVTSLHARTIVETVTMIAETAVIGLVAQMTGEVVAQADS